jgi:hypothetical protein
VDESEASIHQSRAETYEDFYRQVIRLLSEDHGGALKVDSAVLKSKGWAVTVTAAPSPEVLLREIHRLRDIALGTPKQAERAELRSLRYSLKATQHSLDVMRREFDKSQTFHWELSETLDLSTPEGGGNNRSRRLASRESVIAEVRRLKTLEA